jgi:hypothetical protein
VLIGVAAAGWVGAEETPAPERSPEAIEILEKVDAAAKAVESVRYQAKSVPTGVALNFVNEAEGSVALDGWDKGAPKRFRVEGMTKPAGAEQPVHLTAGGNGETYFLIDAASKKAYEDIDPGVMGRTGQALRGLRMDEFVHNAPFDDELNAQTVKLEGKEPVEGVECYKILVVYSGGQGESTWYFSTQDYLPRRRVRKFTTPQGDGAIDLVIKSLEVAPKFDGSTFALALPAGFQKIDDFAP